MGDRSNHESRPQKRRCPAAPRKGRPLRATSALLRREPELEEVIVDLERRLTAIEPITTRDYDEQLTVIEALAAPYAIAFLYEIRRLEAVFLDAAGKR